MKKISIRKNESTRFWKNCDGWSVDSKTVRAFLDHLRSSLAPPVSRIGTRILMGYSHLNRSLCTETTGSQVFPINVKETRCPKFHTKFLLNSSWRNDGFPSLDVVSGLSIPQWQFARGQRCRFRVSIFLFLTWHVTAFPSVSHSSDSHWCQEITLQAFKKNVALANSTEFQSPNVH